jgi:hypothetical protein
MSLTIKFAPRPDRDALGIDTEFIKRSQESQPSSLELDELETFMDNILDKYNRTTLVPDRKNEDLIFEIPKDKGSGYRYASLENLWNRKSHLVRTPENRTTERGWEIVTHRAGIGAKYLESLGGLVYSTEEQRIYLDPNDKFILEKNYTQQTYIAPASLFNGEKEERLIVSDYELMPCLEFDGVEIDKNMGWDLKVYPFFGSLGHANWNDKEGIAKLYARLLEPKILKATIALMYPEQVVANNLEYSRANKWKKATEEVEGTILRKESLFQLSSKLRRWMSSYATNFNIAPLILSFPDSYHGYPELIQFIDRSKADSRYFAQEVTLSVYLSQDNSYFANSTEATLKYIKSSNQANNKTLKAKLFRIFTFSWVKGFEEADVIWEQLRKDVAKAGLTLVDVQTNLDLTSGEVYTGENGIVGQTFTGLIVKDESLYRKYPGLYEFNRKRGPELGDWDYWADRL